jgi:hypothetical protein
MIRICLALIDMNNRIFGPYLAAIGRTLSTGFRERESGEPKGPSAQGTAFTLNPEP